MSDIKEIMAGSVFTSEPNANSINHRAYDIANYAVRLEGWRDKGVVDTSYKSSLLGTIEKMRSELDTMEKWAKLEKPE